MQHDNQHSAPYEHRIHYPNPSTTSGNNNTQSQAQPDEPPARTELHYDMYNNHFTLSVIPQENTNSEERTVNNPVIPHVRLRGEQSSVPLQRAVEVSRQSRSSEETGEKEKGSEEAQRSGPSTELHVAAREGNLEETSRLFQEGVDVNIADFYSWTPLHWAAANGHIEIVELLIKQGANIHATNKYGSTPLHLAADNGHTAVIEYLISQGASIEAVDHETAKRESQESMDNTSDSSSSIYELHSAIREGELEEVLRLIQEGVNINIPDGNGWTALHHSVASSCTDEDIVRSIVKLLLEKGANIEARDKEDRTALEYAQLYEREDLVRLLAKRENQVSEDAAEKKKGSEKVQRSDLSTELHTAAREGNLKEALRLIEESIDVNIADIYGWTPLHYAASNGHADIVSLLISRGAKIEARDKEGRTPLDWARKNNHVETAAILEVGQNPYVLSLLSKEMDADSVFEGNLELLIYAVWYNCPNMVQMLLENGINPNVKMQSGWTLLHSAAHSGYIEIVRLLLSNGAEVNAINTEGYTPLYFATVRGNLSVVLELLAYNANVHITGHAKKDLNPLQLAAKVGDVNTLRLFLTVLLRIDDIDYHGRTLLHLAAQNDNPDIIKLLIKESNITAEEGENTDTSHDHTPNSLKEALKQQRKLNINSTDNYGQTALHLAAKKNNTAMIFQLLEHGADVNIRDKKGFIPLDVAQQEGSNNAIRLLTAAISPELLEPIELNEAARYGDFDEVMRLITNKADINAADEDGYTALHWAAMGGHTDVAMVLLNNQAKITISYKDYSTPLHFAASVGDDEMVRLLLENGVDINAMERDGTTPLHYAALGGHLHIIKRLVKKGANINAIDKDGKSPLYYAATKDHNDAIELLLAKGADINAIGQEEKMHLYIAEVGGGHVAALKLLSTDAYIAATKLQSNNTIGQEVRTQLYIAVENGHVTAVKLLLENGANVATNDKNGSILLHIAAANGHIEVVELLLKGIINIDNIDYEGRTALHCAARNRHKEVVELLLRCKANIDITTIIDKNHRTALHHAVMGGCISVVKLLLAHRMSIYASDAYGENALHYAARNNHRAVAAELLAHEARIDERNNQGETPLHLAAYLGHTDLLKLLLEKGADIEATTPSWGSTPLSYAVLNQHVQAIAFLIENGASITVGQKEGNTLLHRAAMKGNAAIVESLFAGGAALIMDAVNEAGYTALHIAAENGHIDVVELLLKKGASANITTKKGYMPLDLATMRRHKEIAALLIKKEKEK